MQNKTINLGHLVDWQVLLISGLDYQVVQVNYPRHFKLPISFYSELIKDRTDFSKVIAIWRPKGMKKRYNNIELA